jgi:hypothetical protein
MARVETIIVGGGIAATNPFTIGALPYIVNNSPASISATPIAGYTTGTGGTHPGIVIAASITDPQPGAVEPLRVNGGAIIEGINTADTVAIGRGATVDSVNNVAVGTSAVATSVSSTAVGGGAQGTGNGGTALGSGALAQGGGGTGGATAIGRDARAQNVLTIAIGASSRATGIQSVTVGCNTTNGVNGAVAIGNGANVATNAGLAIGFNATATGADAIAIGGATAATAGGAASIVIGGGSSISAANSPGIVLGTGLAATAANQCWIGSSATIITTCIIGRGNTSTSAIAAGLTIRGTDGSGTNIAVGDLTIIAPRGTGNATSGAINLQVGVTQASGATPQTARTGVAVRDTNVATETYLMVYDVDNATLERVTVGAADSGGAGFKVLRIPN